MTHVISSYEYFTIGLILSPIFKPVVKNIFGQKWILDQKNLDQKNFGSKKILVQKKIGSKTKSGSKKN